MVRRWSENQRFLTCPGLCRLETWEDVPAVNWRTPFPASEGTTEANKITQAFFVADQIAAFIIRSPD